MRYVLVLSLLLIGCGPSKLEIATEKCDSALAAGGDFRAAVRYCQEAMQFNRNDPSLRAKWDHALRMRSLAAIKAADERFRAEDLTERQVIAAERAALAAEQQANALSRAEAREH